MFQMTAKERLYRRIFFALLVLILMLGFQQTLTNPTERASALYSPVIVSEFVATGGARILDEENEPVDWIELHNRSGQAVNIFGWSLTDDPTKPDKWVFPELTLPADGYLIVLASGKDRTPSATGEGETQGYYHTNFRLSGAGGFLGFYNNTSRRYLDGLTLDYPAQFDNFSYGYYPSDGTYRYLASATPGAANDTSAAWAGVAEPVEFSVPHGVYTEPLTLELSTAAVNGTIRYTTDGSQPSESNGAIYAAPIGITSTIAVRATVLVPNFHPSTTGAQTYIFLADVLSQPAEPPGWPQTWGVYQMDFADKRFGTPAQTDYAMDPAIVDNPRYAAPLREGLQELPVVSLVTDLANWDIYSTPQSRGPEFERPMSVEFFYPDGRTEGFQVNAGVRIQGGAGRMEHMPKHSFRLFFRGAYGAAKLAYPLFSDSIVQEFNTLTLRAGVHDAFAGDAVHLDRHLVTYIRDQWARESQIEMLGLGSHGLFVHLYLNGLYWGLYNLVERPDASFDSAYLGGPKEEWYAANQGGSVSGQIDRFAVLLRLAEEGELADPTRYATMLEFVDPEQFSDYVLLHWFIGARDWPETNWYVGVRYPAGRNLFWVWDAESSWNNDVGVYLGSDGFEGAPFPNVVKRVFDALIENLEFRVTLADRIYRQLYNDGPLTDANSLARWERLAALVESSIAAESARWGDVRFDEPITLDDWLRARDFVAEQMPGNGAKLIASVRAAGYYPSIDSPIFNQSGGAFFGDFELTMQTPTGQIYFTTDGTDPRLVGGGVNPAAQLYNAPVRLSGATTVQARVLAGDEWSALHSASFWRTGESSDVRITELMYNPADGDGYEFVEITNLGAVAADLSLAYFEGIDFRFPRSTTLAAGESKVLIRDFPTFRSRYATADFHGIYTGKLSNQGETIILRDASGAILDSVAYDDENEWPWSADGRGDSLVLARPDGDPNDASSWRVSVVLYGSPGETDLQPTR